MEVVISADPGAPCPRIILDALRITDAFIIRKCIVQRVSASFTFKIKNLDGAMLDKAGTRLFQSSDPLQLKVFHGNVCAHDMNVVSTVSKYRRSMSLYYNYS